MITAREQVLHLVFHDFTNLYVNSSDDHFDELWFDDLDGAQQIVDKLILRYTEQWPIEAKRELGFALGASLVHRRPQMTGWALGTQWEGFDDPADALYGYVFWELFPGRGLSSFVDKEINWDSTPLDEAWGQLPAHDWSEFQFPNPLRD